jgi:hypothetical protein
VIQNLVERIKQLVLGGIGFKVASLIGGAVLITALHGIFWGLIAPAFDTAWYIITHASQIFHK